MEVHERSSDGVLLLMPRGRVDSSTAPLLGDRLTGALESAAGGLVLDLAGLDYISSAGFRVLLIASRQAQAKGVPLHLCGLSAKLMQLFDLAGFVSLFSIHAQQAEAISAASAKRA